MVLVPLKSIIRLLATIHQHFIINHGLKRIGDGLKPTYRGLLKRVEP